MISSVHSEYFLAAILVQVTMKKYITIDIPTTFYSTNKNTKYNRS